jgi:MoaA/NifB/PqqE/SkfB family radical SAM enzyme
VNTAKNINVLTLNKLINLPNYFVSGIKFNAAGRVYTPKPLLSAVSVTHRCNSQCIMCIYWKEKNHTLDMSANQIGDIYKDSLFSDLERLTLSGGEATLRNDLVEITDKILDSCRQIKEITLCTNGLDTNRVVSTIRELLRLTKARKVPRFSVSTSLDGIGQLHENIRRVPHAFDKISKTISELQQIQKKDQFYISATCVVQPLNLTQLVDISVFGRKNNLPITFVPISTSNMFTDNDKSRDQLRLSKKDTEELLRIFSEKLAPYLSLSNKPFWREYFKIVDGSKRRIPCFLLNHFAHVDSDGTLRGCGVDSNFTYGQVKEKTSHEIWFSADSKNLRRQIKYQHCVKCTIHCNEAYSLSKEFFYYAGYLLNEKWRSLTGRAGPW